MIWKFTINYKRDVSSDKSSFEDINGEKLWQ